VASKQFAALLHSQEIIENVRMFLNGYDFWKLAAMQTVTMEAKKFLVVMAVARGVEGWVDSVDKQDCKEIQIHSSMIPKRLCWPVEWEKGFQLDKWGLVKGIG
jgi:chaperone required for assembly of F1-ATPase